MLLLKKVIVHKQCHQLWKSASETSAAPQAEEQALESEARSNSGAELEDGAAGAEERMSGAEFPEGAEEESRRRKRQTPGEPQGIVGARLVVGGARKVFKPRERE